MTDIASSKEQPIANQLDSPAEQPPPSDKSAPGCCQFFFADGRQCRMPVWKPDGELCLNHARQWHQISGADQVAKQLGSPSGTFKTANDVNYALGNLFSLLAKNQIARRDAAVLAYIGQLLLQSLSPMNAEVKTALGWDVWKAALEEALANDDSYTEQ